MKGTENKPSHGNSYLFISKNGERIHIASVPSSNCFSNWTNMYRFQEDESVDNIENFLDDEGNGFKIFIWSVNCCVDWKLKAFPKDPGNTEILSQIKVEYRQYES